MKIFSFKAFIICLLFFSTNTYAQFLGGTGNGTSDLGLSNVVCSVVNTNPFQGGQSDGSTNIRLLNIVCPVVNTNPFQGGQSDGSTNIRLSNLVCPVINTNPFLGGQADGHTNLRLTNLVCPVINTNPFLGGIADGHTNIRITNLVCTIINSNPFLGGTEDGHSKLRLENVSAELCADLVLPIELINFTAEANGSVVDINWTTASEINNDFFTIEKSINGFDFYAIAVIPGAGTSRQQLKYSITDSLPFQGVNYYRLKQTDFDLKFDYSGIIFVHLKSSSTESSIYPNPNVGVSFIIKVPNSGYRNISIKIQGLDGKIILSETVYESGTFEFFPSIKLLSGLYIISISDKLNISYHKLIVK